jgi:hypothetical protein
MNRKFESRYKISNEIWQEHVKNKVNRRKKEIADHLVSTGEDAELINGYDCQFSFKLTGDIQTYFDTVIANGHNPHWNAVAHSYPRKDFDQYLENVKYFWNWFLEDSENRYPSGQSHPEPKLETYFWKSSFYGSLPLLSVREPEANLRLFSMIYGETFTPEIEFPIPLGKDDWIPKTTITAESKFYPMFQAINNYLFKPNPSLEELAIVGALDYWISTIEVLLESNWFDEKGFYELFLDADCYFDGEMPRKERPQFRACCMFRQFWSNMYGYHVEDREDEVLRESMINNDPAVAEYLLQRLTALNWSPEHYKFLDFIHRHKEKAVYASEGEAP